MEARYRLIRHVDDVMALEAGLRDRRRGKHARAYLHLDLVGQVPAFTIVLDVLGELFCGHSVRPVELLEIRIRTAKARLDERENAVGLRQERVVNVGRAAKAAANHRLRKGIRELRIVGAVRVEEPGNLMKKRTYSPQSKTRGSTPIRNRAQLKTCLLCFSLLFLNSLNPR